jgi:hypothetical protein
MLGGSVVGSYSLRMVHAVALEQRRPQAASVLNEADLAGYMCDSAALRPLVSASTRPRVSV